MQVKRRASPNIMNRKDLELMFWIPLGILSLMSIWISERGAVDPASGDVNDYTSTLSDGSKMRGGVEYTLVENSTMIDPYHERYNVLRYAALVVRKYRGESRERLAPISVYDWARLLLNDDVAETHYTRDFVAVLQSAPMNAYFFETKGVNSRNSSQSVDFEFALVESAYLEKFADAGGDSTIFGDHFEGECAGNDDGCAFVSLGGQSVLIAPMKWNGVDDKAYGHLAAFVRRAPREQVEKYWSLVLRTYVESLQSSNDHRVWLSTDGTGVAWLHMRLDPEPKYYDYRPFAE